MRHLVPLLVLLAVAATACSSGDSSSSETSGDTATTVAEIPARGISGTVVTITNFAFSPAALEATPGEDVTVKNEDGVVHTLTAEDKSFDTSNLSGGESAAIRVAKTGTFPYICTIHQYMKGAITVG